MKRLSNLILPSLFALTFLSSSASAGINYLQYRDDFQNQEKQIVASCCSCKHCSEEEKGCCKESCDCCSCGKEGEKNSCSS